jgi:PhnB protein
MSKHIHLGRGSVRTYLYGKHDLPDFVSEVFGARELERHTFPNGGHHVEAEIGDSIIVVEAAESFPSGVRPTRNSIYVYVADVDAAYKRALEMGATSITPPEKKPYQEHACGVKDRFGNIWYISTYIGSATAAEPSRRHIRNGVGTVRPYVYGGLDLLDFVKFMSVVELERNPVAGGFHVDYQIGDSVLVAVAMEPPYEAATRSSVYIYVADVDAAYKRAMEMGATSIAPPENKPYQERACGVKDSFGNTWYVATYTG